MVFNGLDFWANIWARILIRQTPVSKPLSHFRRSGKGFQPRVKHLQNHISMNWVSPLNVVCASSHIKMCEHIFLDP